VHSRFYRAGWKTGFFCFATAIWKSFVRT